MSVTAAASVQILPEGSVMSVQLAPQSSALSRFQVVNRSFFFTFTLQQL